MAAFSAMKQTDLLLDLNTPRTPKKNLLFEMNQVLLLQDLLTAQNLRAP